MLLEAFSQSILRWLRIPPGASLRKASGPSTSSSFGDIASNDYIQSIVSITVDDICIGDAPLSINFKSDTPEDVQLKLKAICDEFNDVIKWAAEDLCIKGYSVYDVSVNKKTNRLVVMPYIEDVEFFLTKDKEVVAFEVGDSRKTSLLNKLIFINYSKSTLSAIDDKEKKSNLAFKVTPEPMQLKNADRTVQGLQSAENSLAKYRAQLSKIVRLANVDIGSASGDTQKDVVDTIASAINANSGSLGEAYTEFDDNIPVLPNRKGLGKVELVTDVPSADIKELADIDYWLGKLNLVLRFPSSYLDFSQNLDQTAVSLIRGDLRYAKLCSSVRTKLTRTLNEFISKSKFKKYEPVFALTQLPTSEDDDVISALDNYVDIASRVDEFVVGDGENFHAMLHRLKLLQDLLATSTNSPTIQNWFEEYREYISSQETESVQQTSSDYDEFEDNPEGDVEFEPENEVEPTDFDSGTEPPEGEFIEPQTE